MRGVPVDVNDAIEDAYTVAFKAAGVFGLLVSYSRVSSRLGYERTRLSLAAPSDIIRYTTARPTFTF